MKTIASLVAALTLLYGCEETAAPPAPRPAPQEAARLDLPPELLRRTRRESVGLARMPPTLREAELAEHASTLPYPELRADADSHRGTRLRLSGRVGLVAPAGERLWILALMTRANGARWTDPVYVVSVDEPSVREGSNARIDGFVVGERTVGRHALPLVLAFRVQ